MYRSLFFLIALGAMIAFGWKTAEAGELQKETRIRLSFDGQEAIVIMFDDPVARDFLSLLPLTLTLEDYANTEKIHYLPRKLITDGGRFGSDVQGDFCYYAPWGNLAIFYKGHGSGRGLYILGRIITGKDALAAMDKSFTATIERID